MAKKEDEEGEEPSDGEDSDEPESLRESLILLGRDVGIAVLIVAIVLAGIYAYTGNWPPNVVVESGSMQHSNSEGSVGVIDTGDIVLVQAVRDPRDVVTYLDGAVTGYETYSNFGDVIVFREPGNEGDTPIIHRAMVYVVVPSGTGSGADVPALAGWPASGWRGWWMNGTPATTPYGLRNLELFGIRTWDTGAPSERDYPINFTPFTTSGFLTKGDGNPNIDGWSGRLVTVPLIIGKARGELPWLGLLKLLWDPGNQCCGYWGDVRPEGAAKNSWDSLLILLVVLIVTPFIVDFAISRVEKRWKARKKEGKGLFDFFRRKAAKGAQDPGQAPETDDAK